MARNKKRKKKKGGQVVRLKPQNYIKRVGRKLPVYQCWIGKNWKEDGKTQVVVARQKRNGDLVFGFYLVDLWCLGLKDTFYREGLSVFEFEEMIEEFGAGYQAVLCEPVLAFNVIYGAIEYAEDLGFSPPKDFLTTQYLLDDVEAIEYIDIEFGKDGKPLYVSGPDDNVERILAILEKNVGAGNYHYISEVGFDYDDDIGDGIDEEAFKRNLELIEEVLPKERVLEKINNFEDEVEQIVYFMQATIAREIMMQIGDNFDYLEEHDDYFFEKVVENVMEFSRGDSDVPGEEEEEILEDTILMTRTIINRIIRKGGVEFLLEDSYTPSLEGISQIDYSNITEQEFAELHLSYMDTLGEDQGFEYLVQMLVSSIIAEKTNGYQFDEISDDLKAEIEEQVISNIQLTLETERAMAEEDIEMLKKFIGIAVDNYDELKKDFHED